MTPMMRPRSAAVNQFAITLTHGGHPPAWKYPFANHRTNRSAAIGATFAPGENTLTTEETPLASAGSTGPNALAIGAAIANSRQDTMDPIIPMSRIFRAP